MTHTSVGSLSLDSFGFPFWSDSLFLSCSMYSMALEDTSSILLLDLWRMRVSASDIEFGLVAAIIVAQKRGISISFMEFMIVWVSSLWKRS